MEVVMMGGDEENPIFHDFLGMSSDDNNRGADLEMEAGASLGLSSEGPGANNSEVFPFHGRKNVISELEASNTFSGRKRDISSSYMSLVSDRMLSIGSDSHENSRMMKALGKEIVRDHIGKSHEDDPCSIQPPFRPTSSLLLHPPFKPRPASTPTKRDIPLPMKISQSGVHMGMISSSYTCKDANSSATVVTQAAADEGSRTGLKGPGTLKFFDSGRSGAGERTATRALPCNSMPKASQMVEPESSNVPSHHILGYPSRQMTIFYAGQAHVFDDVHPNKADVIMALAGSSGVSWSTNCSPTPGTCPPGTETKAPSGDNGLRVDSLRLIIPGVPDRGFIAQAAQIPITNDFQSLLPGSVQGSRAIRGPRLTTSAVEHDTDGKRDVR